MLVHLGVYGFVEMVIFVSILAVGLIYAWIMGSSNGRNAAGHPPQKAEDLLRLKSGDYEIDEERRVLLFRRLPHGFPPSTRDAL